MSSDLPIFPVVVSDPTVAPADSSIPSTSPESAAQHWPVPAGAHLHGPHGPYAQHIPYGAYGSYAPYGPVAPGPSSTNGLAVTSLVLGVSFIVLSVIASIPAAILGHVALGQIRRSQGRQGGRALAIAGLVLGYFGIGIFGLGIATQLMGLWQLSHAA
jgi:hypothetical protein